MKCKIHICVDIFTGRQYVRQRCKSTSTDVYAYGKRDINYTFTFMRILYPVEARS